MIKKALIFFSLISLFIWGGTSEASTIRIGLASKSGSVVLSSASSMVAKGKNGAKVSGKRLAVTVSGGYLTAAGKKMTSPVEVTSSSPINYDKKNYLGKFSLLAQSGKITVVNVLDVESYLRGVLKMEANPEWPMEALKAQAIISRTFALNQMGRHGGSGFDVCPLAHCQVYRGINAHDPRTDKAIAATKGRVLTYRGKLARAFFHSDSGGRTASVKDVWGGDFPYLRSVADPIPSGSPYSNWTATLSGEGMGRALAKHGYSVGRVTSLSVAGRDVSGRVTRLNITGTGGRAAVKGSKFRDIMGTSVIKSTLFDIKGSSSSPPEPAQSAVPPAKSPVPLSKGPLSAEEEILLLALVKKGVFSTEELMDMLKDAARKRFYLELGQNKLTQVPPAASNARPGRSGGGFVFEGRGWGHGVGLPQWAARALALSGWSADKILKYYYPGTAVTKR